MYSPQRRSYVADDSPVQTAIEIGYGFPTRGADAVSSESSGYSQDGTIAPGDSYTDKLLEGAEDILYANKQTVTVVVVPPKGGKPVTKKTTSISDALRIFKKIKPPAKKPA